MAQLVHLPDSLEDEMAGPYQYAGGIPFTMLAWHGMAPHHTVWASWFIFQTDLLNILFQTWYHLTGVIVMAWLEWASLHQTTSGTSLMTAS